MATTIDDVQDWLVRQLELIGGCKDEQEKTLLTNQYNQVGRNLGYYQRQIEQGREFHFCKECGVIEFATYTNSKDLVGKQLCFHCNFWQEREAIHLAKPNIIVGGVVYSDGGHKTNGKKEYLGHAGREFNILTDDGEEWITNNLWCDGTIPLKYRLTTMRDNARFL